MFCLKYQCNNKINNRNELIIIKKKKKIHQYFLKDSLKKLNYRKRHNKRIIYNNL